MSLFITISLATCDEVDSGATTNARLAAAIATFILHHDALLAAGILAENGAELIVASQTAFNHLKTVFEEEFPHGR